MAFDAKAERKRTHQIIKGKVAFWLAARHQAAFMLEQRRQQAIKLEELGRHAA